MECQTIESNFWKIKSLCYNLNENENRQKNNLIVWNSLKGRLKIIENIS